MKFRQTFVFVKLYCLSTLISDIARFLLICKLYCFRRRSHVSFKYAQHNHLHCPMMGEVSLET